MRYIIRFETTNQRWLVVDSAVAGQVMGVHRSEKAAREQARVEEDRWNKFKPIYLASPEFSSLPA
jgi:hypothetical protein